MAGALCGLFQNMVGHPFDTAKVLIQMKRHPLSNGPFRLYNGFIYPTTMDIISHGLLFPLNTYYTSHVSNRYMAGALTGLTVSPLSFVFDMLKLRRQIPTNQPFTTHGLGMAVARKSLFYGIWLGSYFHMVEERKYSVFASGGASGVLAWSLTYPLDVIKTRQMVNKAGIWDSIAMGPLRSGYLICITRAFLVNSVGFTVYDTFKM